MNKFTSLFALIAILFVAGCSTTEPKPEPVVVVPDTTIANGDAGEATQPVIEIPDPTPVEVPRATQIKVIGVIRELRANGCIVQKVANTDGIHYSQLVVTCADPQEIPEVQ